MRYGMAKTTGVMVAATLGLGGCLGGPEDVDTAQAAQPVLSVWSPMWRSIAEVANEPDWRMAHAYGRSVAFVQQGLGLRCSGAMVSDTLLMTADHCIPRDNAWVDTAFGRIGPSAADHATGLVRARTRLMQLGVPYAIEHTVTNERLGRPGGVIAAREPGRDVVLVRVGSLVVDIPLDDGSTSRVQIAMGDVWGRVPVRDFDPGRSRPGYALSVNARCNESLNHVLLSPGVVTRAHSSCLPGYSECFDSDADLIAGSSGGPYFDSTFQQVIGVNHAEPSLGNACSVSFGSNTIARLGPTVIEHTTTRPAGGWPDDLRTSNPTAWAGGTGGITHVQPCHPGMLVRGLVGSTSAAPGYVGNLGIVCQPHVWPGSSGLHSAVVFAPGSHDTNFALRRGEPFHEYFASVRSSTAPVHGEQTLALCPTGFYLRGLHLRAGNSIDRILMLECASEFNATRTLTLPVQEHIGYLGVSPGGQPRVLRCGPGAYVSGMTIRAGWHTDAIQLQCSMLPS